MSQRRPTDHEQQQLKHDCPVCEERAGHWCMTRRGASCPTLHVGRPSDPVQELPAEVRGNGTLKIDDKIKWNGVEWEVNNIVTRLIGTNHIDGEQDAELIVVLTRKIPKQGEK